MNRDTRAFAISFAFLFIFAYGITVFNDVEFRFFSLSFSVEDNVQYFTLFGLIMTFVLFLKLRREKTEAEEEGYSR